MTLTDKQVQDYVGDDDVEGAEEDEGASEVATVCLPIVFAEFAVRRHDHAVVHDLVPVLPSDDAEQEGDAADGRAEV